MNLPRFQNFLAELPGGHTHVVEFRDASWLVEDVFQLMEQVYVYFNNDIGGYALKNARQLKDLVAI